MVKEYLLGILDAVVLMLAMAWKRATATSGRLESGGKASVTTSSALLTPSTFTRAAYSGRLDLHPGALLQQLLCTLSGMVDLLWIKSVELLIPFSVRRLASEFAAYLQ